jgi:hypothetical protein
MSEPRGFRNNNFGNIIDSPFARKMPGYAGSDGRFARFASPDAGVSAMSRLLDSYGSRGFDTIEKIVGRWSPPNENDTAILVNTMARRLGVKPGDRINMGDPAIKASLVNGLIEQENGRKLPDETVRAALGGQPMYSPPYDPRLMDRAQAAPASPFGMLRQPRQAGFMGAFAPMPNSIYEQPSSPGMSAGMSGGAPYAPSTPFRDPSLDEMQVGPSTDVAAPAAGQGIDFAKLATALGGMAKGMEQKPAPEMAMGAPMMNKPQVQGLPQMGSNQMLLALARSRMGRGGGQQGPMPGLLGGI